MEIIKKVYQIFLMKRAAAYKILISKKIFSNPEKKELLIYDETVYRNGYESFFDEESCFVFETRYKRLYILLYIKYDILYDFFQQSSYKYKLMFCFIYCSSPVELPPSLSPYN